MKIVRFFCELLSISLSVLLALMLILNLLSIGLRYVTGKSYSTLFGFTSAVVVSGSMEPEISVNDMVIVKKQKEYANNDVITYVSENGNLITHRIVEKAEDGFITKGDANNSVDPGTPVSEERIVGKVIFIIPHIGLALEQMQTPFGEFLVMLFGLLLILFPFIWRTKNSGGGTRHEKT